MKSTRSHLIGASIDDFRRRTLRLLQYLLLAFAWCWWCYLAFNGLGPDFGDLGPIVLLIMPLLSLWLTRYDYITGSLVALLGVIAAISLTAARYPASIAPSFGVLAILLAHGLLGPAPALATAAVTWGSVVLALHLAVGADHWAILPAVIVLYSLVWVACWLVQRPLRASVAQALSAWEHSREALAENRRQRGELYRVLRALEEATVRLERANRDLSIARREAELARIQKARFTATVSHELRGPLNIILGFSRMMALSPAKYDVPLPASYLADVDAIYRNSEHLVALIDDVLDVSRIEAERLPLVKDRVELEADVIRKVVGTVRLLAARKNLLLREELAGNLPWVLADQVRLRQVLLNLLTNAIRVTEKGEVVVRTVLEQQQVIVSVQDTGPGIPAEDLPTLFQEFRQTGQAILKGEGAGLGLAISKKLIELHGGQMWVQSVRGQGTCFSFTIPLPAFATTAITTHTGESATWQPERGETLLVVHPDVAMVRLLGRYLEGCRVVGVPDAGTLQTLSAALHPRAILADLQMAEAVHAQMAAGGNGVPVLTCHMPRLAEQDNLEGIVSYIIKPIDPEMLSAVMLDLTQNAEQKVLIVDDDPDAVRLLRDMLTALPHNYTIYEANDGAEAIEIMHTVVPDVAFVDLLMPDVSGRDVVAHMHADPRLQHVRVVVFSALDWREEPAAVRSPITLEWEHAISLVDWARCLRELLQMLRPTPLAEPTPV